MPALYAEDLIDALEYSGLKHVDLCTECVGPFAPWAGYAGAGKGLCKWEIGNTTEECVDEMRNLKPQSVLSVTWTQDYLQMWTGVVGTSGTGAYLTRSEADNPRKQTVRWDLNRTSLPDDSTPDDEREDFSDRFDNYYVFMVESTHLPVDTIILYVIPWRIAPFA